MNGRGENFSYRTSFPRLEEMPSREARERQRETKSAVRTVEGEGRREDEARSQAELISYRGARGNGGRAPRFQKKEGVKALSGPARDFEPARERAILSRARVRMKLF